MPPCNHDGGCQLPGTIHVFDEDGRLMEIYCRHHAAAVCSALVNRFSYVDASTGRPYIRVTVEVILDA